MQAQSTGGMRVLPRHRVSILECRGKDSSKDARTSSITVRCKTTASDASGRQYVASASLQTNLRSIDSVNGET